MKRIIAICFVLLLLCGCGAKQTALPVLTGVAFDASVKLGNYEGECSVKAYGGGVFSCEVTAPASIKGTQINFDGEKATISFMGLKYETETPMPCKNIAEILNTVVSLAARNTATKAEDGHYIITGKTDEYAYTVTVTEAGLPVKIESEDLEFYALIKNASIMQ